MKIIICDDYTEMSAQACTIIEDRIRQNPALKLGLATGSTPEGLYADLVRAYEAGKIDFSKVQTFNLDEYTGIPHANPNSYHRFMDDHLFSKVNIPKENIHFPDDQGEDPADYDERIQAAGGLDIQLLGMGRNGHIAFNEPEEKLWLPTHETALTQNTIQANARFFDSVDQVPTKAITMGIRSIMKARELLILANGKDKREAVATLLRGDRIYTACPVTLTLLHPNCTLLVDRAAVGEIKENS